MRWWSSSKYPIKGTKFLWWILDKRATCKYVILINGLNLQPKGKSYKAATCLICTVMVLISFEYFNGEKKVLYYFFSSFIGFFQYKLIHFTISLFIVIWNCNALFIYKIMMVRFLRSLTFTASMFQKFKERFCFDLNEARLKHWDEAVLFVLSWRSISLWCWLWRVTDFSYNK